MGGCLMAIAFIALFIAILAPEFLGVFFGSTAIIIVLSIIVFFILIVKIFKWIARSLNPRNQREN